MGKFRNHSSREQVNYKCNKMIKRLEFNESFQRQFGNLNLSLETRLKRGQLKSTLGKTADSS